MAKKFRVGRPCVIDSDTEHAMEGILVKVPHKNRFGEWFVVVATVGEAMDKKTYEYYQKRFDVRILKERVKMK
jgi:hypothetical protein